jgi:glycosyltransferase involved in cell wall biosynthesis
MRVAVMLAAESVSGPARQIAALAGAVGALGVELEVQVFHRAAAPPPVAGYLERAGVRHRLVRDRSPVDWRMLGAVQELVEDFGADLVQTHGYKATAIGYALRRMPRALPWLASYHGATDKGVMDRGYQWLERRLIRLADAIMVMSEEQAARFRGCAARVEVVHNAAVPLPEGCPLDASRMSAALSGLGRPLIGVVSRLSREKGVDVFLRACADLAARGVGYSAVVAGDGPHEAELKRLASELGLDGRVTWLGPVTAVGELYSMLDLVVLPSRSEGLPNVLLEALSMNTPVVATAVGAVPDVLGVAGAGVLVPPGDHSSLSSGIIAGLGTADNEAARRARAVTVAHFSLGRRAQRHLLIYRALARTPAVRARA